ncbi:DUF5994 family protein [Mycobacterium hubeiense]|uniref:DUF5994 family protein n=1 Tax=Mycobacterium hubeiense TaxID=1867256 RepID=UPI000C7F76B4|nr:DUF5994 family protein [Mycobacterium sp. QGD 101]
MVQVASKSSSVTRLALCGHSTLPDSVDGAWWPKSTDLKTELPDLVAVFGRWLGPVHRVVYDRSMWQPAPSRIIRGNSAIAVDPYQLVAGDTIYLMGTHSRSAVLYVVPPSIPADAAGRILGAVSDAVEPMQVVALRHLVRHFTPTSGAKARDGAPL